MPDWLPDNDDDLKLLNDAVEAAAEIALDMAGKVKAWDKADRTPVSDADIAVDKFLHEALRPARPDYGWLSEETEDDPGRLKAGRVFVVDPIDGTRAYLKDRAAWSISLAVVEEGRPVAACVYNPVTDEKFAATADGGASLNGAPVQITGCAQLDGCRMLGKTDVLQSSRWTTPWPKMGMGYFNSMAYRICLVASGQWDAAVAFWWKGDWDLAAADLITQEAGGTLTDHRGNPFRYNQAATRKHALICASPGLHGQIVDHVRDIVLPHESTAA